MERKIALSPKHALRLNALGTLLQVGPKRYAELSSEIREFTTYLTGPWAAIAGSSLEVLRFDGLVRAVEGAGMTDNAVLEITDEGRDEFVTLMSAPLGASEPGLHRLFITLKIRFLHLLDPPRRDGEVAALAAYHQNQLDRLTELRQRPGMEDGHLVAWLDCEIDHLARVMDWLDGIAEST